MPLSGIGVLTLSGLFKQSYLQTLGTHTNTMTGIGMFTLLFTLNNPTTATTQIKSGHLPSSTLLTINNVEKGRRLDRNDTLNDLKKTAHPLKSFNMVNTVTHLKKFVALYIFTINLPTL